MKVQMTPVVAKHIDMLTRLGYKVDILSSNPDYFYYLHKDVSLETYSGQKIEHIQKIEHPTKPLSKILKKSKFHTDIMAPLHKNTLNYLLNTNLSQYSAILTFSPFSSVNNVMVDLKKSNPNIPWIAQFSDPWARNPLENNKLVKLWNAYFEPKTIRVADAIVHSSPYSLSLMLEGQGKKYKSKMNTVPHFFVDELYPQRPKQKNDLITLRFLGTLFQNRNPDLFFNALNHLLCRRQDLNQKISIELIGTVPEAMVNTIRFPHIPKGLIKTKKSVSYLESLELMYDADILLLIEADVKRNIFFPTKLIDYLGANQRIVGMVPPGCSRDVCEQLKTWCAAPSDTEGLSCALEGAIDDALLNPDFPGYDPKIRNQYSIESAAEKYNEIINNLLSPIPTASA